MVRPLAPTLACQAGDGTQAIACGETKTSTIGARDDADAYTFLASGGETVVITTVSVGATTQPGWYLFSPSGAIAGAGSPDERGVDAGDGR